MEGDEDSAREGMRAHEPPRSDDDKKAHAVVTQDESSSSSSAASQRKIAASSPSTAHETSASEASSAGIHVVDDHDEGAHSRAQSTLALAASASLDDVQLEDDRGIMDATEEEDMQREVRQLALADPIEDEQLEAGVLRSMSPPPSAVNVSEAEIADLGVIDAQEIFDDQEADSSSGGEAPQGDPLTAFEPVLSSSHAEGEGHAALSIDKQPLQDGAMHHQQQASPQQWTEVQNRPYAQQGALDTSGLSNLRSAIHHQRPAARIYSYPTDADSDAMVAEIDEFYSYVEAPQVGENRAAWEEWCELESKANHVQSTDPAENTSQKSAAAKFSGALGLGLDGPSDPHSHASDAHSSTNIEWISLPTSARRKKIQTLLTLLEVKDPEARLRTSRALLYLLQGSFADTQGSVHQLQWINENARMIRASGGLGEIFAAFKVASWKHDWLSSLPDNIPSSEQHKEGEAPPEPLLTWQIKTEYLDEINLELALHLAQLYILVETQRGEEEFGDELMSLDPPLPIYLFTLVSSLREKNAKGYPVKKLLLLLWKSLLACFGGLKDVKRCKHLARELEGLAPISESVGQKSRPLITKATPIDFQTFQEELSVKYPTFEPPRQRPGDLPIDKIASAISPIPPRKPLSHGEASNTGINTGGFTSTPAPSPPPSPKPNKQKYQTDQSKPFIFPYSKSVQGSRLVPYSIEEASRLYRNNMYVSLELWQLWRLREEAIHEESGVANAADGSRLGFGAWDKDRHRYDLLSSLAEESSQGSRSPLVSEMPGSSQSASGGLGASQQAKVRGEPTLDRLEIIERELDAELKRAEGDHMLAVIDNDKYMSNLEHLRQKRADTRRLQRVDLVYRAVLPHLQNSIIVLLKLLLATVTQQNNNNSPYFQALAEGVAVEDAPAPTLEDIDIVRHREITSKGISGILLLLLKWFKVSHVMKFNFVSQLLVDSNCLLLILKMFGLTEINNQVKVVNEIPNFNFFRFCSLNCGREPRKPQQEDTILARQPFEGLPSPPLALANLNTAVEEYEYMKQYSFRNFFAGLNFTRILQKLTKRKTHRILLLVQYKSSAILKRTLKVPHPDLQLCALKIIKSQVPFCGRKWRQSNMKVITAIYLRCRPDLRDEWLSGADIDGDVEESLPQEQALRSLTKYYNQTRIGTPSALPSPAGGSSHGHRRSLSTSLAGQMPDGTPADGIVPAGMLGGPGLPVALQSPNASARQSLSFFESETLPPLRRGPESTAGTRRYIPDDLLDGYLDDYEDLLGELFGEGAGDILDPSALSSEDGGLHGLTTDGSRYAWGVLNQMLGEGDELSDSESVGSVGIMGHTDRQGNDSEDTGARKEGEEGAQTWEALSPEAMRHLSTNRPTTPAQLRRRTSHGKDGIAVDGAHEHRPGSPNVASPLRPVLGDGSDDVEGAAVGTMGLGSAVDLEEDEDDSQPLPPPTAGGIDEVEHIWGA